MEVHIVYEDQRLKYRIDDEFTEEHLEAITYASLHVAVKKQHEKANRRRWSFINRNSVSHEQDLIKGEDLNKAVIDVAKDENGIMVVNVKLSCNKDVNKKWFKNAKKTLKILNLYTCLDR